MLKTLSLSTVTTTTAATTATATNCTGSPTVSLARPITRTDCSSSATATANFTAKSYLCTANRTNSCPNSTNDSPEINYHNTIIINYRGLLLIIAIIDTSE